ncbi:serine/arginine repetitive matrix protein 1 isoform X1 [Neodiprion lecontei]|uniref:Serine/arginine repetitive matrix protein 1 isoform X1 n=2 Tax=Neodiprion lecontei TaxID=441921 RepID=A0A6J0C9K1_NEOLC|nr:serine/arginine repetitive matrix protein 1 isoform X1 [Neodiprion lecontei]XP_046591545.1 serine/arginine repetitive matrix protein 1 isoform X1 [Neodiprion lecontei]XP_046591546.1 serine/arginine repetitive matrix protein 1 isoform X1 [Neodiprion lecontei]
MRLEPPARFLPSLNHLLSELTCSIISQELLDPHFYYTPPSHYHIINRFCGKVYLAEMSRDYDSRRRGGNGSGSSKMRMDTNVSQSRPHGESSGKRRELDNMMRKARESQSSYWNKKLLEVEERDPNRWRHSGYKELYIGGTTGGEPSRGNPRSPRSPRPRSPHSPRPRSPRPRSPRSPRERTSHANRTRVARSPSSGSTCSDRSCSVCSPKERRRVAPPSRSRSRSFSASRSRPHVKEIPASSSRVPAPRARPRSPPLPRPRTPPPAPQPPPSRHHKEYKQGKEKEAKARRKEKHHSRVLDDPRVPDPIPLMRKPVKVEKMHPNHPPPQSIQSGHPPLDSSASDDSDSSSNTSHVGPPRMTLSERFGKMAQWSVDRRDMENMRITKDGENAMKVVIEGEERIARLGYDSPPPGHYPESLLAQGPRGLESWDDVRVRYDYYKARGYLRDLTLDDYVKWEEWWYKYQEWLEAERYYEQWATNRPSGGGRKRRGRRNNNAH